MSIQSPSSFSQELRPAKRRKLVHDQTLDTKKTEEQPLDAEKMWQIISSPEFYIASNENSDTFERMVQDAILKVPSQSRSSDREKSPRSNAKIDRDARLWLKKLLSVLPEKHNKAVNALDENGTPPINYVTDKSSLRELFKKHGAKMASSREVRAAEKTLFDNSGGLNPASGHAIRHALSVPGMNMNRINLSHDRNALMQAVLHNRPENAEILLRQHHVDINQANQEGYTPLMYAAANDCSASVKSLLAKPGIEPFLENTDSETALTLAASQPPSEENREIIKMLLAQPRVNVNHTNEDDETPLILAARQQNPGAVKALLAHPDIDVNYTNWDDTTALTWAAESAHADNPDSREIIEALLAKPGIQVNELDDSGETPLSILAEKSHLAGVKALLAHPNIDLNAHGQLNKALNRAINNFESLDPTAPAATRHEAREIMKLLTAQTLEPQV